MGESDTSGPRARPRCDECYFYENSRNPDNGWCKRYPPAAGEWPYLSGGEWCGEHQPAEEVKP